MTVATAAGTTTGTIMVVGPADQVDLSPLVRDVKLVQAVEPTTVFTMSNPEARWWKFWGDKMVVVQPDVKPADAVQVQALKTGMALDQCQILTAQLSKAELDLSEANAQLHTSQVEVATLCTKMAELATLRTKMAEVDGGYAEAKKQLKQQDDLVSMLLAQQQDQNDELNLLRAAEVKKQKDERWVDLLFAKPAKLASEAATEPATQPANKPERLVAKDRERLNPLSAQATTTQPAKLGSEATTEATTAR
jgi:hypothetical protein